MSWTDDSIKFARWEDFFFFPKLGDFPSPACRGFSRGRNGRNLESIRPNQEKERGLGWKGSSHVTLLEWGTWGHRVPFLYFFIFYFFFTEGERRDMIKACVCESRSCSLLPPSGHDMLGLEVPSLWHQSQQERCFWRHKSDCRTDDRTVFSGEAIFDMCAGKMVGFCILYCFLQNMQRFIHGFPAANRSIGGFLSWFYGVGWKAVLFFLSIWFLMMLLLVS